MTDTGSKAQAIRKGRAECCRGVCHECSRNDYTVIDLCPACDGTGCNKSVSR